MIEQQTSLPQRRQTIEFLRRRLASAILSSDDGTATRLRAQLDLLMNGRLAKARPSGAAEEKPAA